MAFTVQDNDGLVSGANAYAPLDFVREYWSDRGEDLSATTDVALQGAVVRATQYLDTRYIFVGCKRNRDQTTEWPRRDALDRSGYTIHDIPPVIYSCVAELAKRSLEVDLLADPERDESGRNVLKRSEGVGPLKEAVEFAEGAAFQLPEYPAVDRLLAASGLIRSGLTSARA